jgi:hypothetical protein
MLALSRLLVAVQHKIKGTGKSQQNQGIRIRGVAGSLTNRKQTGT